MQVPRAQSCPLYRGFGRWQINLIFLLDQSECRTLTLFREEVLKATGSLFLTVLAGFVSA